MSDRLRAAVDRYVKERSITAIPQADEALSEELSALLSALIQ